MIGFLILIVFIQLLYYWGIFLRFICYKSKCESTSFPPVSVVICARDEAYNLQNFLPCIMEQNYPNYEVVVVNDMSTDNTAEVLDIYAKQYSNLKVITLDSAITNIKGKKLPLSIGIKSAKNDILLLTDADCKPCSEYWIQNMTKYHARKSDIVLGYGAYRYEKTLLNSIVRYDTMHTAIQYFSYALCGMPYMGVGRNLSYTKSFFFEHNGFQSFYNIYSGDDDLFINNYASQGNIHIEYNKESQTESLSKSRFILYKYQKIRHLSTSKYYKKRDKFLLGLYSIMQPLFYIFILFILLLLLKQFNISYAIVAIVAVFLKVVSQTIVFGISAKKLGEKNMILLIPIHDFIYTVLTTYFFVLSRLTKKFRWR